MSAMVRSLSALAAAVALLTGPAACANPPPPNPSSSPPVSSTPAPASSPPTSSPAPFPTGFPATDTAEQGNYCALAAAWWYRSGDVVQVHVYAPGPTRITARTDAADGHPLSAASTSVAAGQHSAVLELPATGDPAAVLLTATGAQNGRCVVQQVPGPLTP